jgi:hypothetical protein
MPLRRPKDMIGRKTEWARLHEFAPKLVSDAAQRRDVELIDLERMYAGD